MDRTWYADPVNFSCLVCPVGSLLGGRLWVSTRKWGLAFSLLFSSALQELLRTAEGGNCG